MLFFILNLFMDFLKFIFKSPLSKHSCAIIRTIAQVRFVCSFATSYTCEVKGGVKKSLERVKEAWILGQYNRVVGRHCVKSEHKV